MSYLNTPSEALFAWLRVRLGLSALLTAIAALAVLLSSGPTQAFPVLTPGTIDTAASGFSVPRNVATDAAGDLFVVEPTRHRVMQVDAATGVSFIVAGISDTPGFSGDGVDARNTRLNSPSSVVVDQARNLLFIADTGNLRIRQVDLNTLIISTVFGPVPLSQFRDVAVDAAGMLFVAESSSGQIQTGLPGGVFSQLVMGLNEPLGVTVAPNGDLYVAETGAGRVVQVVGGSAVPVATGLNRPRSVEVDTAGNLFVSDTDNHSILRVDAGSGAITTLAGTPPNPGSGGDGGPATSAGLNTPSGLALDTNDNLFIADESNGVVRRVALASLNSTPMANDDFATVPELGTVNIDVLANDNDPDGDPLTVSIFKPPLFGTATVTPRPPRAA